ncbi:MAG: hypothetical protein HY314_16515 [Acidobacteria bacterium]|nr:hypothetical protein [Acidobacteriota bacterium]
MMRVFALILIFVLSPRSVGVGFATPSQSPPSGQVPPSQKQAPESTAIVRPEGANVFVLMDERLFILMAALNVAGYNYEPGGRELSPLRKQLRRDLAGLDPELRARLANYYKVHLRGEGPPRIGGYVALSLAMLPPPSLSIPARRPTLPEDLLLAADFAPLVKEFYAKSEVAKLIRPAMEQSKNELGALWQQTGAVMLQTLNYLHTIPILSFSSRSALGKKKSASPDQRTSRDEGLRVRRLFVILNPLDASEAAYIRNDILNVADRETKRQPGDDYFVVVGSSSAIDPIRRAFLRFVLEPLGERFALAVREQAQPIIQLAERVIGARAARQETAFSIVNESLARAVETRLKRLRAQGTMVDKLADEEAVYDLSTHYEQGAVLVFHFYEKLIPWEQVGVDIAAYYEAMLSSINFEREAARSNDYKDIRARVEAQRAERVKAVAPAVSPLLEQLGQVDALVRERKFERAQTLLRDLVKQYPNNARVLYSQAQVVSQVASQIEPTRSADEDTAWEQLMTQLAQAVELYRQAIAAASLQEEKWLISQSHVAVGKILDFANQRDAAVAEYQKAIELGDVPGGAYAQAKERLANRN